MDRKLIGRCGKFCGECRIYLASHGDEELRRRIAAELGVDSAAVACEGCQGPAETCFHRECKIVQCLTDLGLAYCAQCAEINDCTKYSRVNVDAGGKPKIYSVQLKQWGEERWLAYHRARKGENEGEEK